MKFAPTMEPHAQPSKPLDDHNVQASRVQEPPVEAELFKLLEKFSAHRTTGSENFDTSLVRDYVLDKTAETYRSAALLKHDRRYGVEHYLVSPHSKFSFAKYPSTNKTPSIPNLIPLPLNPSFESKLFGWDKDDADSPGEYVPPRPTPWTCPITDAPPTINPLSLLDATTATSMKPTTIPSPAEILAGFIDPLILEESSRTPAATDFLPRPTINLPSRVQQLYGAPPPLLSNQSASDYSAAPGSGSKRKAATSPATQPPQKKAQLAVQPLNPRNRKASPLICGIDQCTERFASKLSLQCHRELHIEELNAHTSLNPGCTSENALQLLQAFYAHPAVAAIDQASATQQDLMAMWKQFVHAVTTQYSLRV